VKSFVREFNSNNFLDVLHLDFAYGLFVRDAILNDPRFSWSEFVSGTYFIVPICTVCIDFLNRKNMDCSPTIRIMLQDVYIFHESLPQP
jgi:hypothetical protein